MEIAVDAPLRISTPFAVTAAPPYIQYPVPDSPGSAGRASYSEGFPPINFVDPDVGGIPPFGADFNGLLRQVSDGVRWTQAGGPMLYETGFAAAVNGYPRGAMLSSINPGTLWISLVDNNTGNPDAGAPNWVEATIAGVRRRLLADLDLFVATTGSDSNDGLTALTPFATLQHAASLIQNSYDLNGFTVQIKIAAGSYSGGAVISGSVPGITSITSIIFEAATGTVSIAGVGSCFTANQGAAFSLTGNGFALSASLSSGLGFGVSAGGGSRIGIFGDVNFGSCAVSHVYASTGGQVGYFGPFETISGSAQSHFLAISGGLISANNVSVTLVGTPTIGAGYANASECGVIEAQNYAVLAGTSLGLRYNTTSNASINVYGGGVNVFPGSAPGQDDGFGFYG